MYYIFDKNGKWVGSITTAAYHHTDLVKVLRSSGYYLKLYSYDAIAEEIYEPADADDIELSIDI